MAWADAATLALIALFFLLAAPRFDLFHANQHTYFPHGLRLAGRPFLQTDWFASSAALHLSFSYLVAGFDSLGVLALGSSITSALLDLTFLLGIWLVVDALGARPAGLASTQPPIPTDRKGKTGALVALALFAGLANRVGMSPTDALWNQLSSMQGLASQSVRFGYLQPSEFGCLAVLGVGLMQWRRWNAAGLAFGVATLFNASLALPCAVLILAGARIVPNRKWSVT